MLRESEREGRREREAETEQGGRMTILFIVPRARIGVYGRVGCNDELETSTYFPVFSRTPGNHLSPRLHPQIRNTAPSIQPQIRRKYCAYFTFGDKCRLSVLRTVPLVCTRTPWSPHGELPTHFYCPVYKSALCRYSLFSYSAASTPFTSTSSSSTVRGEERPHRGVTWPVSQRASTPLGIPSHGGPHCSVTGTSFTVEVHWTRT